MGILSLALFGLAIYLIVDNFGKLADYTQNEKWKWILAGIGAYWVGGIVGGIVIGLLFNVLGLYGSIFGTIIHRLLNFGVGIGGAYLCYNYLRENYPPPVVEEEHSFRQNTAEPEQPIFKKSDPFNKDVIDDIFDNTKDIRK